MLTSTGEALLAAGYRMFKACSCTRAHDSVPDLASVWHNQL